MDALTLQRAETAAVAGTIWTIDPARSTIGFSVKHMVVATVRGRFGGFRGTIRCIGDRPESVEAEIDAASVDTGIRQRDDHLRSADFFDVAAYPTIVFRTARVEPVNPLSCDRWLVVGDLTMHGVTRSVDLAAELTARGPNAGDADVISFAATTKINRKDFGIGINLPLDRAEFVIGDEVRIAITVQALKEPIGGR